MRFNALANNNTTAQTWNDAEARRGLSKTPEVSRQDTADIRSTHTSGNLSNQIHLHKDKRGVSTWSRSAGKRIFDYACVIASLPIVLPILAVTALLVRLTSQGPILFIQDRVGLHGETFRIFKFRSMEHLQNKKRNAVTSSTNQRFTPVGPFLRRFKLDELPQLFNVLKGDMSLVGPRPKMPEHVKHTLSCRPGITGYATLAFAREEMVFSRLPKEQLESFYHDVVLPAKRHLDEEYMAHATLSSDLGLILNTVLRRWDVMHLNRLVVEHMRRTHVEDTAERPARKLQVARVSDPVLAVHKVGFAPIQEDVGSL